MSSANKIIVAANDGIKKEENLIKKMPLWVPLRHTRYRNLWISNAISNTGSWMQAMAAAWLMTSLTTSPLMTALIQTATNLPIFLFAVFAGTLADKVDRPKFLLIVNTQMAISALILSVLITSNLITPWLLLFLIFTLGCGAAFMWPAWQASMSGLVEHAEIPAAATLNGLSYNLASVIGPALGGLLFKVLGASVLFSLNAVSFLGLIFVYYQWWRSPHEVTTTDQRFWEAFTAGFKAVARSPSFRAIMINTAVLMFATSAFLSLLPLVVRDILHQDSSTYGLLMGSLGIGAVIGAFTLANLRARFTTQKLLGFASVGFGLLLAGMATIPFSVGILMSLIAVSGLAWVIIVSSLNVAAQAAFELKMRARVLSIYMLALAGGQSFGSYTWGLVTSISSLKVALIAASLILFLSPLLALRWPVEIKTI